MRVDIKRTLVFILMVLVAFVCIPYEAGSVYADTQHAEKVLYGYNRQNTYKSYIETYKGAAVPQREVNIPAGSFTGYHEADIAVEDFEGRNQVVKWTNESGWMEWMVTIPETGLYHISVGYFPLEGKGREIQLALEIDGRKPFSDAENLTVPRIWKDAEKIKQDVKGNDLRPKQIEKPVWWESVFKDVEGLHNGYYQFYFEKGTHNIRLYCLREAFALDYLKIFNARESDTYRQVYEAYKNKGYQDVTNISINIPAETPFLKSDPILYALYDRSSPVTEPYHPAKIRMNTIGSSNWKYPGQWITWKVTVPESGLYTIGVKYRQNMLRGMYTNRKITIDGAIPCKELENVKFPYGVKWQMKILGGEEPYRFYLEKGTHEIGMEVVLGDISDTLSIVEDCVYKLNYLYRKIIMITSPTPDKNRDYYLEKEIPDLLPNIVNISKTLKAEAGKVEKLTGVKGSEASQLARISAQLDSLVENPETISTRLDQFKSNISSLSTLILTLREQPLELDYIVVQAPERKFPRPTANIIQNIIHEVRAFIATFTEDYNSLDTIRQDDQTVNVWINGGRDQVQILRDMIDNTFTPVTGIKVKLSLVPTGIIEATLAGKGPDVHLNIPRSDPVNLAMRGALADVSQFEDFDAVTGRFYETAMIPYQYRGKYYALPVQQNFSMMFYRKDIFEELKIHPPDTWDDLLQLIPIIQRNNMGIGIPASPSIYGTLLLQRGRNYYNENLSDTILDQPEAIDAFKQWTGLYTDYSLALTFDFFNRFRTGEMPLGIASYTLFNQLSVAAPEIRGLWEMMPIPGTKGQDGRVNRAENADGSACILMENAKNKKAAWELLKWWTSADVQAEYGRELENIMGSAARYDTANKEAFTKLPWAKKESDSLIAQWQYVQEIPEIPGSYYTTRCLDFAFRSVCYDNKNPREQLYINNRYIREEIKRKRIEFGLEAAK